MKRILILFVLFICLNLFADPTDRDQHWRQFQQKEGSNWSVHWAKADVVRSLYGRSTRILPASELAVNQFIADHQSLFGVDDSVDLRLKEVTETHLGNIIYFNNIMPAIRYSAVSFLFTWIDRRG